MASYSIGRHQRSDIVLLHPSVSRHHAELAAERDRFRLKDLDSRFGCFVWRGDTWRKIRNAEIAGDERILLGKFETTAGDLMRLVASRDLTHITRDSESPPEETRKLAAIVVADMVDYGRLMRADEAGTLAAFMACRRELIDPTIFRYRGRVFKDAGDAILAEFAGVVDAVRAAVDMQLALGRRGFGPAEKRLAFRFGIHLGEVIVKGADNFGDVVNVAARLQQMAPAGGICVSALVYDQVKRKLPVKCDDLGEKRIKSIPEPLRVYAIRAGGG
jgi:class 3 adenylate cyclase